MAEYREKRAAPRSVLPSHPTAWTQEGLAVRLLDLSLTGARIEHLGLLRLGLPGSLELPAALGFLVLPTQVVWCAVTGAEARPGGDRSLRARSGLKFAVLTEYQQTVLARALQELTVGGAPA
jgi:hypothetical protein